MEDIMLVDKITFLASRKLCYCIMPSIQISAHLARQRTHNNKEEKEKKRKLEVL